MSEREKLYKVTPKKDKEVEVISVEWDEDENGNITDVRETGRRKEILKKVQCDPEDENNK